VVCHDGFVHATPAQDPAVDHGVEGLDSPAHDLRETGVIRDLGNRNVGLRKGSRGAACGQDLDTTFLQATGQIDEAGLVGYADERAFDANHE
jgi:hypothetical protein